MRNWYHIFPKNTGLSLYAWIIFCLLPFYFIIRSSVAVEIIIGIIMIVLFFTTYRLSFIKKGWTVYVSVGMEMAISIGMTLYFGYVYFALFLAFFIGNIQNKAGFITLYIIHLTTSIAAVTVGFFIQSQSFFSQLPFIVLTIIGVILLPISLFSRNRQEELEGQLADANKRISQLMVVEERQRIARDLHDTLGQKLSLIGLKSDLAKKLVDIDRMRTLQELNDINQTARTALKEVRELVSNMKDAKLQDEVLRVQQVVEAAQMEFKVIGELDLSNIPLLVENVLSMCLKEAITNVVKHSKATLCQVSFENREGELLIHVEDDGIGIDKDKENKGHGIEGMQERLEFVNGNLDYSSNLKGTRLTIQVPTIIQESKEG
ncbi:two-component system, NarL family, sensor histidine kinase DesK [Oceanobacillus limi]|uniref:histidine kinase n=1 Tax=Oceanobacillus limi TaxID=930131 RepID=A0A1I0F801_9BACI|nr:sensor histidine kinase [Oceanobacillus limi]SET53562.1 two-component system, NarL family, sensor histidine kinase DesK [Oceanobacillus limi]